MSEFRHMFFNQTLQISARFTLDQSKGRSNYPDKTTMDYHCIFMTMSQPPTADYIARSSICIITRIHIDLYQLTP